MGTLVVAAGGGGDALGARLVQAALEPGAGRPVIMTFAWERLRVDPLPGPRSAADFQHLRLVGADNYAITAATVPRPPSGSTLPRLAGDLDAELLLLDTARGARGLRAQIGEMVALTAADRVRIVDIGGDAVARGDEPGLRSPLADSLVLAACADLDVPVTVVVAGPGLDGELAPAEVLARLAGLDGSVAGRVRAEDVQAFGAALSWHPSEATALLAAAALGSRGAVEIRDQGAVVRLDDGSAAFYTVAGRRVVDASLLAPALAETRSLDEAEAVTRAICGFSEIDYERAKSTRPALVSRAPQSDSDLRAAATAFAEAARSRGTDYVTYRRLAEAVAGPTVDVETLRRIVGRTEEDKGADPLWSARLPGRM